MHFRIGNGYAWRGQFGLEGAYPRAVLPDFTASNPVSIDPIPLPSVVFEFFSPLVVAVAFVMWLPVISAIFLVQAEVIARSRAKIASKIEGARIPFVSSCLYGLSAGRGWCLKGQIRLVVSGSWVTIIDKVGLSL